MSKIRTIAAYLHDEPAPTQDADPAPGAYYVTAIDPSDPAQASHRKAPWFMLGPLPSHQLALDMVESVRKEAASINNKSVWLSFGTVRVKAAHHDWPPQCCDGLLDGYPVGKMNGDFEHLEYSVGA